MPIRESAAGVKLSETWYNAQAPSRIKKPLTNPTFVTASRALVGIVLQEWDNYVVAVETEQYGRKDRPAGARHRDRLPLLRCGNPPLGDLYRKAAVLAATGETFEDVAERRENQRSLALESAAKEPGKHLTGSIGCLGGEPVTL